MILTENTDCLLIDVWDSDPRIPDLPRSMPDLDSLPENGRGLAIVSTLAKHSGFRYPVDPEVGGKIMFATMPYR